MPIRPLSRRSLLTAALAAPLAAVHGAPGWAQPGTPAPVTMIVPYAPGGSADIFGRIVAGELAKKGGTPVSVENKPGGGGGVGLQIMDKAAPDGRTLLLGQTGEIVVQPFLMQQAVARPVPVAMVAIIPLAVVVPAKSSFTKLRDLVEASQAGGRGISAASPGRLTPGDLAIELLRTRTGGKIASVPFNGGGPALDAVADGLVDVYFSTLTSAMPAARAGKVRILAVTSEARSPVLPDTPTVTEAGVRRFAVTQWAGVFAPRGTPDAIVGKLNGDVNAILAQPEVAAKITQDGGRLMPLSPSQFAGFIGNDEKVYREMLTAELCAEYSLGSCSGGGVFAR